MQKVVIGREFTADADILVIAQPTRGVDVGAIEFIHKRIIEMRARERPYFLFPRTSRKSCRYRTVSSS